MTNMTTARNASCKAEIKRIDVRRESSVHIQLVHRKVLMGFQIRGIQGVSRASREAPESGAPAGGTVCLSTTRVIGQRARGTREPRLPPPEISRSKFRAKCGSVTEGW